LTPFRSEQPTGQNRINRGSTRFAGTRPETGSHLQERLSG
jgi:hypothetical protein